HRRHRLFRRRGHVEIAIPSGRGVREHVLVDPFDGVADLGRNFGRREHQIVDRDLDRRRMRRNLYRSEQQGGHSKQIASRTHGGLPYFSLAATCSACCWWPWKIFRPVCSRLFNSALLADGINCVSSAPLTALW